MDSQPHLPHDFEHGGSSSPGQLSASLHAPDQSVCKESVKSVNMAERGAATADSQPTLVSGKKGPIIWIFVGLALAVFISALDETIVATAAVTISSKFDSFGLYSFISVTYLVAVNAVQPLYATLSDTFGRKAPIMVGVSIFFIGSVGCGWAQSMPMFLASRAVAGLGAGGLVSLAFIVIADIFPMEERGKYQGVLMMGFSLATVLGPILGGVFTEELSWRWSFWINLPIIAVTFGIMVFLFRYPRPDVKIAEGLKRVDFLGSFLLAVASVCFLIPLSLGGEYWSWKAPQVIVLFVVSALALAAFYLAERRRGPDAMVPLRLFHNRGLVAAWVSLFFYSTVFITFFYYLPVWFQVVGGKKPAIVAVELIPVLVGTSITGLAYGPLMSLASRLIPSLPPTRTLSLVGVALFLPGTVLRAVVTRHTPTAAQVVELLVFGLGAGLTIQSCFMAAQSAVPPEDIAMASSISVLSINMGDAVGLAVSGTINRVTLARHLARISSDVADPTLLSKVAIDPGLVYEPGVFSPHAQTLVVDAFEASVTLTFKVAIAFAALTLFAVLFVRHPSASTPDEPYSAEMHDLEKQDSPPLSTSGDGA